MCDASRAADAEGGECVCVCDASRAADAGECVCDASRAADAEGGEENKSFGAADKVVVLKYQKTSN